MHNFNKLFLKITKSKKKKKITKSVTSNLTALQNGNISVQQEQKLTKSSLQIPSNSNFLLLNSIIDSECKITNDD